MTGQRKLIEVALPLEAINLACKADKDRKTGTIRNLHKWFAPMPLPAWRALLFAALVDDPGDEGERDRLMRLIERLVENGGDLPDKSAVDEARREIARCWPQGPPKVADVFCGGGSTLVEAQRLGCDTVASDLNPVPVLITKVLTELLPSVAGAEPLHESESTLPVRTLAYEGVVADIVHYSRTVERRAHEIVAELYPPAGETSTIAWLWCRDAQCPNPACGIRTPLATSWVLSKKPGEERWVVPSVIDRKVEFGIGGPEGAPPAPPKTGRGANFACISCNGLLTEDYLGAEGHAGRIGMRMTAVIDSALGESRIYRVAREDEEAFALRITRPDDAPTLRLPNNPRWFSPPLFGFEGQADLYTNRQLRLLSAFATAVRELPETIDADGGTVEYARVVSAVLGLCVGKLSQYASTQALIGPTKSGTWFQSGFTRSDVPMNWDFCEVNPFAAAGPSWAQIVTTALRAVPYAPAGRGIAVQGDAQSAAQRLKEPVLFATDPPYFDQIGYADLSDYFYVWLRLALRGVFPELFATVATPKHEELVALPTRHDGDRAKARRHFINGFIDTFAGLSAAQVPSAPILVVYAFKEQSAKVGEQDIAPGWEAILESTIQAGLMIVGTLPIHGTGSTRMIGMGTNALATYVVLVCRPRPAEATRITRSDFARTLRTELTQAVAELQKANIVPVDLAQTVIGPGMEVFSRHSSVVETDGSRVGVAQALAMINQTLGQILDEQEGDLDPDSRWAVTWYEQHGFSASAFGEADQLARAKGIAVNSLVEAGIVSSGGNKVALIERNELADDWDPRTDRRATAWEGVQYLVRALEEGGESAAAALYARLGALADPTRELAYRLYQIADDTGRKQEAIAYNSVVASWSEVARLAESLPDQPVHGSETEAMF